jgi:hypothetical protein
MKPQKPGTSTLADGVAGENGAAPERMFTIEIADDALDEREETIELSLRRTMGTIPGTAARATATIADNDDPAPPPAPPAPGTSTPSGGGGAMGMGLLPVGWLALLRRLVRAKL